MQVTLFMTYVIHASLGWLFMLVGFDAMVNMHVDTFKNHVDANVMQVEPIVFVMNLTF